MVKEFNLIEFKRVKQNECWNWNVCFILSF